jgi:mannose-6-phosphate isomerase-like protein (cupin superfamily)
MKKRVFKNPVIGDELTLLKSSSETQGEYTLCQIIVVPGGGNSLHIHRDYSEKFEVEEGELSIQLGKEQRILKAGESITVPKNVAHCFNNRSDDNAKFRVVFRPAQPGFEKAIAIAYGLASDGLVNKNSVPYNFSYLSILVSLSGTTPAGLAKFIMPVFRWIARRSKKNERTLVNKYC